MDYGITELRIFIDNRIKDIKPSNLYNEIIKDIELSKKIGTILNYFEILFISEL